MGMLSIPLSRHAEKGGDDGEGDGVVVEIKEFFEGVKGVREVNAAKERRESVFGREQPVGGFVPHAVGCFRNRARHL